jgi:hypothetical protein
MGTQTIITTNAIEKLEDDISELTVKLNGVINEYNKVQADMTTLLETNGIIDQLKTQFNLAESDLTNHKGKIDTLIADVKTGTNNHTGKIDTLIDDVEALKDKITSGYSASQATGGGSASDAILKRLSALDEDYKELSDHYQNHVTNTYNHSTYGHSSGGRSGTRSSGGNLGDRYIDITEASIASEGNASGTSSGTASDGSAAITAVTNDDSTSTANASVIPSYASVAQNVVTLGNKGEVKVRKLARQTLNRLRK